MTDLEGVAGVGVDRQLNDIHNPYYRKARELLAEEINAAICGAQEAGAHEFIIADGHGSGFDLMLDLERIAPAAKFIIGLGGGYRYAAALEGVDAAFLVGQHPRKGPHGSLEHTGSDLVCQGMWLNGVEVGEAGMHAAILGEWGIPLALATGDEELVAEVAAFNCGTVGVAVKKGLQRQLCVSVHPVAARQLIRDGATRAVKSLAKIKPWRPAPAPYQLAVKYASHAIAAKYAQCGYAHGQANLLFPYLQIEGDLVTITGNSIAEVSHRNDLMNRVL